MTEPEWKELVIPDINSRWDRSHAGGTRTVRVMGYVEGYVIARHSGCIPFVTHMSDWYKTFTPKIMPKRQRKAIEKPMAGDVGDARKP
jgi:hypothetical protein